MGKFFYILGVCFFVFSCSGQSNDSIAKTLSTEKEMNIDSLPGLKRRIYAMELHIPGPFELYVNDFPARIENGESIHNTAIEINRYILKSGKYTFRLRVLPSLEELQVGGIQPATASRIRASLIAFERNTEKFPHSKKGSYRNLISYPAVKIEKPVPYIEITGEFEAEVPYDVEGWSNSEDLSKIDKAQLEKQVISYYQQLHATLNNGDGKDFIDKFQIYHRELLMCEYTPPLDLINANNDLIKEIETKCKNNMLPLQDYTMCIYGQGRLVRLEKKPTYEINNKKINIKGRSVLMKKGKVAGVTSYPLILHRPKGSNTFEIIRSW